MPCLLKPNELQPGDVLLYEGNVSHSWAAKFVQWAIRVKTWSRFCHVELYLGQNKTATARLKGGVNTFDLDPYYTVVLRPLREVNTTIDTSLAYLFHQSCVEQKQHYDVKGLLRFFRIGKESTDTAFCSEHVTRLCRRLKILYPNGHGYYFKPFSDLINADLVAPATFYYSPHFKCFEDRKEDSHLDTLDFQEK